jgi:flagellar motor switch protein FliG
VSSTGQDLSGVRKAALLVLALGEEASAAVLKRLSLHDVEKIGQEIARMGRVENAQAGTVLEELLSQKDAPLRGGKDQALRLVEKSLGPDGSRRFLDRISQDGAGRRLEALGAIDPQHLVRFIEEEHPQTIALVIAHLDSAQGAQVFRFLPEKLRGEVSVRIARLEETSPDVLDRIARVLNRKLQTFGDLRRENSGGARTVAALLNALDRNLSREVLDTLEINSPEVALSVRNLMFVFDDMVLLDDKAIRQVLQDVDKTGLAVALKGTTTELQDLFFRNMSQRAGENLKEEMDLMGPVKLKDVEQAQKDIVDVVRKLEEEGTISLGAGADEYVL